MTAFTFEVVVSLKPGLLDPQGKAVEGSLPAMGFDNVHARPRGQAHQAAPSRRPTRRPRRAQVQEMADAGCCPTR